MIDVKQNVPTFSIKTFLDFFKNILQVAYPVVFAAIFVCGIGGTFHYGYSVSVMTSPSVVSEILY